MIDNLNQISEPTTLDQFYNNLFDQYGQTTAIELRERDISYATFDDRTAALANFFRSIGLGSDDCVGILMQNRPEYLTSVIAAARAGVIAVPLNSSIGIERIKRITQDNALQTLIVGPELTDIGHKLQQSESNVGYYIGISNENDLPLGFHSFGSIFRKADATPPAVTVQPSDVAAIHYTTGTTGEPKGTVHTHEKTILNIYSHLYELEIGRREQMLLVTPLGHSAGFFALAGLVQGATIRLERGFDVATVARRIADDTLSWTYLIPTMISELLDHMDEEDTHSEALETIVYGSAPLSPSKVKRGIEMFGDVFIQFYGLTEVPNLVTVLPKERHDLDDEAWLRSAGRPARLADVTVFTDENDWDDEVGEIGIRAAYAMEGYLHDRRDVRGERDWIRTGDIGRIDDHGRLFVLDRMQDIIIVDRNLVISTEIENVIEQHDDVLNAAVIGVPRKPTKIANPNTEQIEQSIKAIIVPSGSNDLSPAEVQRYCRDSLSERQVPDSIDTVGALPETPFGAVDKQLLREPYW